MEVKHGARKRLEFYEGQKDPRNVWRTVQNIKRSTDFMFVLGLNETIDQLVMANSVCWYGHVLRREDGLVLRRA